MIFKTYGYMVCISSYILVATTLIPFQALNRAKIFAYNMKLGHYMKVPPRTMFFGQLIGSVISATAQLAVHVWVFSNIE